MQRRAFVHRAAATAAAGAAAAIAAPALAQTGLPEIRWRLASSFPKSLDVLFGTADNLTKRVADATGGRFQIRAFAGGEIVPALGVADAVQQGTVEMGHTASYYYVGKNPAFAIDCTLPFGMNSRMQAAWMYHGGGLALMREFFKDFGIVNLPAGNTGAQMGGWFRKEVKSLADFKGLKMRIPGFGGRLFAALGAIPQNVAPAEIYQALERGSIDAVEFVGPHDDEKLGFVKVAKFYYYPGFWEPGPALSLYVNQKSWDSLPKEYRAILEAAAAEANINMQAEYDAKNPAALQRLVNAGAQLRAYPRDAMQQAYKAALDIYADERKKVPQFGKIYESWDKFRADQVRWFRVAEGPLDNFMFAQK
ncbi:MAG: TRAP transporter substrate-binding protein [Burkholderiaceae bacterium]|jgi:TRAP-type mannitol/chloroaromatic compound transport system substrate-binding protein|nr:TRAP transporter substrate-binding protein [Burkholderiaceae bacterium]